MSASDYIGEDRCAAKSLSTRDYITPRVVGTLTTTHDYYLLAGEVTVATTATLVDGADAKADGRRRDAAATRRRLLHAARRRFTLDGYKRTTLRQVAADAGVNLALIKRYFGSKEGLFEASLTAAWELGPEVGDGPVSTPALAGILARQFSSRAWPDGEHPILLFLRSTADARTDVLRRRAIEAFTERLLRAADIDSELPDPDLLRVQLIVALGAGISVLRAAIGLQPLLDADSDDLIGPLTDVIGALLPAPRADPPGTPATGPRRP